MMASESGGRKAASFSCMKLPSLTKQIQKILADYPDGGQIIKELIQNAEDASATKITLVCDERDLTYARGDEQTVDYSKFFEGPALCVYNDALFQPDDWEGIRMIDESVKEGDRLKIGRFGQGFKSVFHLTDYPCILSGDTMLCIDPQQQSDKVNAMMDIRTMHEYEGIEIDAFFNAFDGVFGVSRGLIENGSFDGTIFRFPLRRMPSKLTSNTYTKEKLLELFKTFENEAACTLLFLKNLEVISLCSRTTDDGLTALTHVTIANIEEIRHQRNIFNKTVGCLPTDYNGDPKVFSSKLLIEYKNFQTGEINETLWLVIHYFIGGNASNAFKLLIKDTELQLCPYVGIAAPIGQCTDAFEGHVFCFLPLPKEGTKLTGLPVHVNGYFALSQSRHHVRWATDGQADSRIFEKAIRWNYLLVEEALPKAYKYWFKKAIEYSNQNANDEIIVSTVHHAFPDVAVVQPNWSKMIDTLRKQLMPEKILYSFTMNRWVTVQNAFIIRKATPTYVDVMDTVIKASRVLDINVVVVNDDSYSALSGNASYRASIFTPNVLANHLRPKICVLSAFNKVERMHILEYLLTDKDKTILDKLPLLPLQSGKWVTFKSLLQSSCSPIYMASSQHISLCQGMKDKFILQKPPLPDKVHHQIEKICKTGLFQIRILHSDVLESLLEKLLQTMLPEKKKRLRSSRLTLTWLKGVWMYMLENDRVSLCQRVPLFPVLEEKGSWDDPDVVLVCLTKNVLLKENAEERLPEDTLSCFKALGVDVITSLPPWIPLSSIDIFVQKPDQTGIKSVLDTIVETGALREKFNCCDYTSRLAFMQYLARFRIDYTWPVLQLLRKLVMFQGRFSYNGAPILTSVHNTDRFTACENFPIHYPFRCLDGYEDNQQQMLLRLNCKQLKLHDLFKNAFNAITRSDYTDKDRMKVMNYFVTQYHALQHLNTKQFPQLVNMAKQIPFLTGSSNLKKPEELFNPFISNLQELFICQEEDKFPRFLAQPNHENIAILVDLGLKIEKDVTASDLLQIARLLNEWSQSPHVSEKDIRKKSNAFVQHLISYPEILNQTHEGHTLKILLENFNCLEYNTNRPEFYPAWIPWFTKQNILCKPKEAKHSVLHYLIGSVMPTVDIGSRELEHAFGWKKEPHFGQAICHLLNVSESYTNHGSVDLVVLLGHLYKWLCRCNEVDFKELESRSIVWNGESFSYPTKVVINKTRGDIDLRPYFHFLPDILLENKTFFENAGCPMHQSVSLLIQTLSMIKNQMSQNNELNFGHDLEELAFEICQRLSQRKDEIPHGSEIFIPFRIDGDSSFDLRPICDCTYIGNPGNIAIGDETLSVYLVREGNSEKVARGIPSQHAIALGVKTKGQQLAGKISRGIPFGQKEDLVERLKGLLRAYPRDESVLKELLQNADDAGATELNFIKDYRTHSVEGVFIEEAFYGPALCVFNNSYFTEKDLEGIHKLGYGGKRADRTTVGQYGVGFNAVYHLTDTPSFISKGPQLDNDRLLCIFDPTCNNIKDIDKTEPGMLWNINNVNEKHFQRELLGFSERDCFQTGPGTMFRFPLRKSQSQLSENIINVENIAEMLRTFTDDLKETLLFLKNVKCIKISDITSGELRTEYSISCSMTNLDSQKKTQFTQDVDSWAKQESSTQIPSLQSNVQYIQTVSDSEGFKKKWLIVQRLGASSYPDHIIDGLRTKVLCYLPVGGIALPILDFKEIAQRSADSLSNNEEKEIAQKCTDSPSNLLANETVHNVTNFLANQTAGENGHAAANSPSDHDIKNSQHTTTPSLAISKIKGIAHTDIVSPPNCDTIPGPLKGKAFAVLPLPIRTGLCFHVNGHFSLDHESRRDLWKEGLRLEWNVFLRQHVIVPCLVEAISYFKLYFTPEENNYIEFKHWTQINTLLCLYHNMFPLMDGVTDEFWKHLVEDFYWHVLKNENPMFPVVAEDDSQTLVIEWVQLQSRKRKFCAVFNTIADFERKYVLEKALKMIGLQLVHTPIQVYHTISECKTIETLASDPSFVITFLGTYREDTEGKCDVGEIGCDISITNYRSVSNLTEIVNYIGEANDFCTKCSGLPIIVTADGVVRECSKEQPVYNSSYSDLLPHSQNDFLHKDLQSILGKHDLYKIGVFKSLDIPAFIVMLQKSSPVLYQDINIVWTKDKHDPVSPSWLLRLFMFLHAQSFEKTVDETERLKYKRFCSDFEKYFAEWAIIPSKRKDEHGQVFELVPVNKAFSVFYPTKSDILIDEVFERLNIPKLDKSVFREKGKFRGKAKFRSDLLDPIRKYFANASNPYTIMQCFLFHSTSSMTRTISREDAFQLLTYFERNLGHPEMTDVSDSKRKLRSLQLYNTLNNAVVSISDWRGVIVVKEDPWNSMPSIGIEQWMSSTRICILLHTERVEQLYKYLDLKTIDLTELYTQYLFKRFVEIPPEYLLTHIEFVRDSLLRPELGGNFSPPQDQLIKLLKRIPFMSVNGCMKKASELFDDKVRLFQCMLDESKFPPEAFRTEKWKPFLICLGLSGKANEQHILKFAKCIEKEGIDGIDETLLEKSKLVLQRFAELYKSDEKSDEISESFVTQMATIRFIFPNQIARNLKEIADKYDDGYNLIAFRKSLSYESERRCTKERLCWTSMNILPDFETLLPDLAVTLTDPKLMKQLGVYQRSPPVKRVLKHCNNISEPLRTYVKNNSFAVTNVLETLYEFLLNNLEMYRELIKNQLEFTPFIYIAYDQTFVRGFSLVIDLKPEDEIKPYLYKAPMEFGKYKDLFLAIGAQTEVTCDHYISILNQLKQVVENEELGQNELLMAIKAVGALLKLINQDNTNEIRGTDLFLPDISNKLTNAKELVLCDNDNILQRIQHADLGLNLFIGFHKDDVTVRNPIRQLLLLPENMRPQLLTIVIRENIVMEHFIIEEDCEVSQHIEDFIHSEDFLIGLLRVLYSSNSDTIENIDQTLRDSLQNVRICRTHGLQTDCSYNGSVIRGSEQNKLCYIHEQISEHNSTHVLYFQADITDINDVILGKDGLINLIEKIVGTYSVDTRLLTSILIQYKRRETIKSLLDRECIRPYHLLSYDKSFAFPKPGTYVEVKFHPFLEQDIRPFDEQAYTFVALELDDDEINPDREDTYIYVKIIGEATNDDCERDSDLYLKYLVDTGDEYSEPVVVPIFRLYRFIRPQCEKSTEMDVIDQKSPSSISYDENCQKVEDMIKEAWAFPDHERKKILKRLLLKWHPDKNPNNQDCCKNVFQFVMSVIERLEAETEGDTTDGQIVLKNSPYQRMGETAQKKASDHARTYRLNIHDYNRSFFESGQYSHTMQENIANPIESRRWWRQARNDFRAADLCFRDVGSADGFNWICYMCHQATEKALKAAVYNIDANNVDLHTHYILAVARSIDSKALMEKVKQLTNRLGEHTRMRYPNRMSRSKIPSDVYDEEDASFSLDITRDVIDMVEELIPS